MIQYSLLVVFKRIDAAVRPRRLYSIMFIVHLILLMVMLLLLLLLLLIDNDNNNEAY
jgi:hypothetical protein